VVAEVVVVAEEVIVLPVPTVAMGLVEMEGEELQAR
jgi:hypothetical protein